MVVSFKRPRLILPFPWALIYPSLDGCPPHPPLPFLATRAHNFIWVVPSASGSAPDWGKLQQRNERVERELFPQGPAGGINFDKYDEIPVEATGQNVPEHMKSYQDGMIKNEIITNAVTLCGYSKPTPVQKYAIPIVLGGRDLMACTATSTVVLDHFRQLYMVPRAPCDMLMHAHACPC